MSAIGTSCSRSYSSTSRRNSSIPGPPSALVMESANLATRWVLTSSTVGNCASVSVCRVAFSIALSR
ncbi:Uncharacterised protein [Mycobacterium tuberculosis]|nr:Uncharacterised protein [Mycobacterium tuberculosis]